jgi:hypothetical protein
MNTDNTNLLIGVHRRSSAAHSLSCFPYAWERS